MTADKTIEILTMVRNRPSQIGSRDAEINIAINTAIEAVEKRIPKTPMYKMVYGKRLTNEGGCIACANTVYITEDFCPYCGQALDWSEVEE